MAQERTVLVIPCSGIGKPLGSLSREAALEVVQDLRPECAETLCLARLTMGDAEAQEAVRSHPVVTIDGCPKACARANVEHSGGQPAATFRAADIYKEHRGLKPAGVIDLGPEGRELAHYLAEEVAAEVDRLTQEDEYA